MIVDDGMTYVLLMVRVKVVCSSGRLGIVDDVMVIKDDEG